MVPKQAGYFQQKGGSMENLIQATKDARRELLNELILRYNEARVRVFNEDEGAEQALQCLQLRADSVAYATGFNTWALRALVGRDVPSRDVPETLRALGALEYFMQGSSCRLFGAVRCRLEEGRG